eukprot:229245_1
MDVIRNYASLFKQVSSESIKYSNLWIEDPPNKNKKILICIGSVWMFTDFIITILQQVTDTDEKNILGPFSYCTVRILNKKSVNKSTAFIFGIPSNLQFTSSKGLAKNMLGGYAIGLAAGIASLSITNSIINSNKTSLSSVIASVSPWSVFVASSCVFYTMEYVWAALFHPDEVSFDSFMLFNHSNEFHIALCFSAVEYWIEYLLFGSNAYDKKQLTGLAMIIMGQAIRTVAQFTAGVNFTHQIAYYKKEEHVLIKHGIYRVLRHPSYFGFFYWSIGTQLLLANPMSTVIYTLASWQFFADRIPFEEQQLVNFFGDEYKEYRRRTMVGIPFIQ